MSHMPADPAVDEIMHAASTLQPIPKTSWLAVQCSAGWINFNHSPGILINRSAHRTPNVLRNCQASGIQAPTESSTKCMCKRWSDTPTV